MIDSINPNHILNLDDAQRVLSILLNLVESIKSENQALHDEVQKLRDEVNRLKGEQGKPDIKPNKKPPSTNHSSEKERKKPKKRKRSKKKEKIIIDREETVKFDRTKLPADARFKGYEDVVVQDIQIKPDNVLFRKEKFHSASEKKTYIASLPKGYHGEFGPNIRTLILTLYYGSGMTEPKIIEFLSHFKISISAGQVSSFLIKNQTQWHAEKDDVVRAGLGSSHWQHIDDTGTRVNGENQYCHVLSNPLYAAYFTRPRKDRLTIIEILQNIQEGVFVFDEQTPNWLQGFSVPKWAQQIIAKWPQNKPMTRDQLGECIENHLTRLGKQQRARVFEAAALSAYYQQTEMPIVQTLICDDAPQFKSITELLALCWVHEGRHYKKLMPAVKYHRELLEEFRAKLWGFYHLLQDFKSSPSDEEAHVLQQKFSTCFSVVTGYDALDQRITKTKAKQSELLLVLSHPEIPLHNNPAELVARQRTRKDDISFGPRTPDGSKAWDSFMTICSTTKLLGVSFYDYVFDRVSETNALPSIADIIVQRSPAIHLSG